MTPKTTTTDDWVESLIEAHCEIRTGKRALCIEGHATSFKVVIDGRRYDTDKLDLVAFYERRSEFGNFCFEEALWKSKSGRWLLAGEGMISTPWRHQEEHEASGYGYVPLDDVEARRWLEGRNKQEELEAHFKAEDA